MEKVKVTPVNYKESRIYKSVVGQIGEGEVADYLLSSLMKTFNNLYLDTGIMRFPWRESDQGERFWLSFHTGIVLLDKEHPLYKLAREHNNKTVLSKLVEKGYV